MAMINIIPSDTRAGDKGSPVVKHSIERQIVMHDVNKMFLKYISCHTFPEQIKKIHIQVLNPTPDMIAENHAYYACFILISVFYE